MFLIKWRMVFKFVWVFFFLRPLIFISPFFLLLGFVFLFAFVSLRLSFQCWRYFLHLCVYLFLVFVFFSVILCIFVCNLRICPFPFFLLNPSVWHSCLLLPLKCVCVRLPSCPFLSGGRKSPNYWFAQETLLVPHNSVPSTPSALITCQGGSGVIFATVRAEFWKWHYFVPLFCVIDSKSAVFVLPCLSLSAMPPGCSALVSHSE